MAEIRIEEKQAVGAADHLYLVFVDDAGQEFVISGGPLNNVVMFGTIEINAGGSLDNSEDRRLIEDRALFGSRVLDLGGRDADDVWKTMVRAAELIGTANVTYNFTTQNSNSTVASVLYTVGINVANVLPNVPGIDSFPGSGNRLLGNYIRDFPAEFASENNDIIQGGHLDDSLAGGAGNDSLVGGRGADLLIGGAGADTLLGGKDDDILVGDQGNDVLNGQVGRDVADYSGQQEGAAQGFTQGVTVTLNYNATAQVYAGSVTDNWGGTDRVTGIEEFRLSGLDDRVTLTGNGAQFFAYDNNKPSFQGGAQSVFGDVIDFGRLVMTAGTGLMVETTGDDREVSYANSSGNTGNFLIASGFEIVLGSKGNDTMTWGGRFDRSDLSGDGSITATMPGDAETLPDWLLAA